MTAYGFALAFFFVVFWAEEVATVMLCLAAAAIVVLGSLWIYHNPDAALDALGIFVVFMWPLLLGWAIYLALCWSHGEVGLSAQGNGDLRNCDHTLG